MIYSINELREIIGPIAEKYKLPRVYLFGSYARGDATDDSDVDVLIVRKGSVIVSLFDLGALYNDLDESLEKAIDLVTEEALFQDGVKDRTPWFTETVLKERVLIYGQRRVEAI
jgi:predicted nucleotidyltransferase